MARPKHTIDAQEALLDVLEHPGIAPLLAELDGVKESMGRAMLKFDLSDSEVLRSKCHYDGAHKLLAEFKLLLGQLKAKDRMSKA